MHGTNHIPKQKEEVKSIEPKQNFVLKSNKIHNLEPIPEPKPENVYANPLNLPINGNIIPLHNAVPNVNIEHFEHPSHKLT